MIIKSDVKDMYFLSPLQEGMLFHCIMDRESTAYFEQVTYRINGELDHQLFEQAFIRLIRRYDVLRTIFIYEKVQRPLQVVLKTRNTSVYYQDISSLDEEERIRRVKEFKIEDKNRGFDLSKNVLIRLSILKVDQDTYDVIWSFHHIIMDGWCAAILTKEMILIYNHLKNGDPLKLPTVHPYRNYIKWLETQDKKEAFRYWQNYLSDYETPAVIPGKIRQKDEKENKYKPEEYRFRINKSLTGELSRFSDKNNVTFSTIFQTLWGILLQRYNDINDVVFGAVISVRPPEIPGIESMVGLFINTVPLRIKNEPGEKFENLVKKVQTQMVQSKPYEYVPLAQVQTNTLLKRELVNHIVVFENYPLDKEVEALTRANNRGFSVTQVETFEQTNYDINIAAGLTGELNVVIVYNAMTYSFDMIERISMHLTQMIRHVAIHPKSRVDHIEILPENEKNRLLLDFNKTDVEYPGDKSLHQLFREQAERTPDKVAVVNIGTEFPHPKNREQELINLTYRELCNESDQLAHLLKAEGIRADIIVGILARHSPEMMKGILGILKAGGAYLLINPGLPPGRISYMLKDSQSNVLLIQEDDWSVKDIAFEGKIIPLTEKYEPGNISPPGKYTCENGGEGIFTSHHLAYVMYTSGSTGKPKGVMVAHRSVARLLKNPNYICWHQQDRLLLTGAIGFDITTFEKWGPLLNGLNLFLVDETILLDPGKFTKVIIDNAITILHLIPQLFNQLAAQYPGIFAGLRYFLVGGDQVNPRHINPLREKFPHLKILHMYGPTENTTFSTFFLIDRDYKTNIPIGKPIANSQAYIFNRSGLLQPVGAVGELRVAGNGVARGYLNQPELTAEKFVEQVTGALTLGNRCRCINKKFLRGARGQFLQKTPPGRRRQKIYKTGDLARWLPDGNIEFLGRIDNQVKIRGFRIEPEEVENILRQHHEIKDAVVIAFDKENNKSLCAYIVTDKKNVISQLRSDLLKKLPEYMVPSCFVPLEKIPLMHYGKVDRKSLPGAPLAGIDNREDYEAPGNETEKMLSEIWGDVLGISHPGVNDDFFDLGGHSLKAMSMAAILHKYLNVEVPIREIFSRPTIKELSAYIKNEEKNIYSSIEPVEEREGYPLSSAQRRLFVLYQWDKKSTAYNIPAIMTINGLLNIDKFEDALKALIRRHQSLRTSFRVIGGEPLQIIHPVINFKIEYKEAGYQGDESLQKIIEGFIRPFDFSFAPLMRCGLVKVSGTQHVLIVDIHHIVSDGRSHNIIIEEFPEFYTGKTLPQLRIGYKDYALWQQEMFSTGKFKQREEYWLGRFKGGVPILNTPRDYSRPFTQSFAGARFEFKTSNDLCDKLKELAKGKGATLYILLLAAYNVLLHKYTLQDDIIVGSPTLGRPHADLQGIVGMFVNMLVMRNFPEGEKSFKEFLTEVKENALKAYENQDYQFEELVMKLDLERDMSRNPIFDVTFTLQSIDSKIKPMEDLNISAYEFGDKWTKFDLSLDAVEREDHTSFVMVYCTRLFKRSTIKQLCRHFINVLERIVINPKRKISEIEILSEEEKNRLLVDFNSIEAVYPGDKTIHTIFEEQVEKTPDKPAAVLAGADGILTYRQLNQKANRLANHLRKQGITSDQMVGIILEPSPEMIVGILGILKGGGAYLPIDPGYPRQRVKYLLNDSNTSLVLTKNQWKEKIELGPGVIDLDDQSIAYEAAANLSNINRATHLAYVIYTSGTTGKPKGVMVQHKNVVRLMFNDKFQFDFNSSDIWTMFHAYNFDFSVWEMYGALLYGGKLVLITKMMARDPKRFLSILEREKVTVLNQVPSAFYHLIAETLRGSRQKGDEIQPNLHLRYVIFGGEALKPQMLKEWKEKYPETRLINMFGITETTVHVTYKEIGDKDIQYNISNIGKSIPTTTTFVVDEYLNLLPVGVYGELCVGGEGVARGYLNQPDLTGEKFVTNPFEVPGERLYKSGDLVKFADDGNMEYLGRIDHQLQIRGFRVEPGEIESKLLQKDDIKEAIVIDRKNQNGDQYLCAYIAAEKELDISELRDYLSGELPDHMVPNYFVPLEKIPITPNGKVDRKQLPEPGVITTGEYTAPEDETQQQLAEIWKRVLNLKTVGITDNFFHAGGDSIKAIRLISLVNNEFNTSLEIIDLYTGQTIEELAGILKKKIADNKNGAIEEALLEIQHFKNRVSANNRITEEMEDIYPMSDIEKGMVFHYLKDPTEAIYHDQALYLQRYKDFDFQLMRRAVSLMIDKHPILRTAFIIEEFAHVVYKHKESLTDEVVYHDISSLGKTEQEAYIKRYLQESRNRVFNHSKPPLWRMGFLKSSSENIVAIWEFHHSIIDGWSNASFLTELNNTYYRLKDEPDFVPKKLKSGYKEFIIDQICVKRDSTINAYWNKELVDYKRLHFPKAPGRKGFKTLDRELGPLFRKKLESIAQKYNTTLKHLCFGAYFYMLSMLSYEEDITVGLVTNSRPACQDADRIIGCFLNTVPVRINIPSNLTWLDYIKLIDMKMVEVKNYDKLSLLEIVNIIGEKTENRGNMFDASFNFIDFYAFGEMTHNKEQAVTENLIELENHERTNFNFNLNINTLRDHLRYVCFHSLELVNEENSMKLFGYFERVLNKFVNDPVGIIERNKILSAAEREMLLYNFNATESEFPNDKTIQELFASQVEKAPDQLALVEQSAGRKAQSEDEKRSALCAVRCAITYGELNQKSNQLAYLLKEKGIQPGNIVGIMMARSLQLIIGLFGILKAGGTYLPIDPNYPEERIAYMLNDSNARILVSEESGEIGMNRTNCLADLSKISKPGEGIELILIDKGMEYFTALPPQHTQKTSTPTKRPPLTHPTHLSYIIYTSGTTGQPKGTMIENVSLVNRLHWMQKSCPLHKGDTILQKTPFTFDVSVWELFWWAIEGANVCLLIPGGEKDPAAIIDSVELNRVTIMHFVPSMLNAFLEYVRTTGNAGRLSSLKRVFTSGEALTITQVKAFNELLAKKNNTRLTNLYGPTEATIDVSYFDCPHTNGEDLESIPIGKPIDNIKLFILNKNKQLQPIAVAGQLWIGGVGLARGYLNKPELTVEKFDHDLWDYHNKKSKSFCGGARGVVFSKRTPLVAEGKIYKTGDLARWVQDGNIEFLGRTDYQVKIRGFRIELEEIEKHLLNHKDIKEVVVLSEGWNVSEQYLCAYYVLGEYNAAAAVSIALELKQYLLSKLPDFMIPSHFIPLEKIPLTPHGKINRKSLEKLDRTGPDVKADVVLPGSDLEKAIAETWKEVLKLEAVSINDNFFDIGGTSLDNIKVNAKLQKAFGKNIPIVAMYRYPTIGLFAQYLNPEGIKEELYFIEQDISSKKNRANQSRLKQRARKNQDKKTMPI